MSTVNPDSEKAVECDVLVVGAGKSFVLVLVADVLTTYQGFGGVYAIWKLRQLGLNVKCFEAGSSLGGVWYWNRSVYCDSHEVLI